jgi:hypothetical protein
MDRMEKQENDVKAWGFYPANPVHPVPNKTSTG